jgi:hypothetical protein
MKKIKRQNQTKAAISAGAAALMALSPQTHAQSSVDALLNKVEQKGILSVDEARELKAENATNSVSDFNKALGAKFPMPDGVASYKLYGDFPSCGPFLYGGQVIWNSKWSSKIDTSLGVAVHDIANDSSLPVNSTQTNWPYETPYDSNLGNLTRTNTIPSSNPPAPGYAFENHFRPVVASGSVTYTLDRFPLYRSEHRCRSYNGGLDVEILTGT